MTLKFNFLFFISIILFGVQWIHKSVALRKNIARTMEYKYNNVQIHELLELIEQ